MMTKSNLKLFIWTGYDPDYSGGLAFAIAEDERSARELVEKERDLPFPVREWGILEVKSVDKPIARELGGGA